MKNRFSSASIIAASLQFSPPNPETIIEFSGPECCAITGEHITEGYMLDNVLPNAIGNVYELCRYGRDYVSVAAASVLTHDWNMGSRVCTSSGAAYHPLVNPFNADC